MARVKVRYFGLFGRLAGKEKEEMLADSIVHLYFLSQEDYSRDDIPVFYILIVYSS